MDIIIRDDDINATTDPNTLIKLYQKLENTNLKISFGITLFTLSAKKISDNVKLCKYLIKMQKKGHEICMHGIYHKKNEVKSKKLLEENIKLFEGIFGKKPKTYIPPFESIHPVERDILDSLSINISNVTIRGIRQLIGKGGITTNQNSFSINYGNYLFGEKFGYSKNPKDCLDAAKRQYFFHKLLRKPFIIVNHHWDMQDEAILNTWNSFLDWIGKKNNAYGETFSGLCSRLSG